MMDLGAPEEQPQVRWPALSRAEISFTCALECTVEYLSIV